jgi:Tol biopolymer transport system component
MFVRPLELKGRLSVSTGPHVDVLDGFTTHEVNAMDTRTMTGRLVGAALLLCVATACAPKSAHPLAGETAWLAYQSGRDGPEKVWLIHPDGSDDHEVATNVRGGHIHPDWSPDGKQLVITSRGVKDTLYRIDVATDTGEILWPICDTCLGDDEAVWSPDGSRVAFVRAMAPFVDDVPSCALYIGDPATGALEPISDVTSCNHRATFPHWSNDGSRIAYYRGVYDGATVESTALYVVDVATRVETKVTEDALFAGDSDWSSNDEWILFSSYPLNDFQCCRVSNLYRIHPDGSGLEQLTHESSPDRRLTQPRFTPDGSRLVVTADLAESRELWILPGDASGEPIVVSKGSIYTHGTWQPTAGS